jgi:ketosteroid isomerase-like protein
MTTREVVEAYFNAWTTNDVPKAYSLLAANLHFAGPNARYSSAEEFRPALIGFAAMTRAARVVEFVVDGDRASLLYDCDLPDPVGTLRIASFFRVADGKISWYETFFDPTELRQLLARR